MGDVRKLREAVEAGLLDLALMEDAMPVANDSAKTWDNFIAAYNGSLDAAARLHDALLPGWTRCVDATAPEEGIEVTLYHFRYQGGDGSKVVGDNACEALAWLLAILRALEGGGDD